MTNERWAAVNGWPHYEVSDQGLVRSVRGDTIGQWPNADGYMLVRLNRPRAMARVHRLVAEAFIPNPHRKPFINHLDCVRSHNVWTNLEWCTQAENLAHARSLGRTQTDYWTGQRSPNAHLTEDQVRDLRARYARGGVSWETLAREFKISKRAAGRVIKRETYPDVQ